MDALKPAATAALVTARSLRGPRAAPRGGAMGSCAAAGPAAVPACLRALGLGGGSAAAADVQ